MNNNPTRWKRHSTWNDSGPEVKGVHAAASNITILTELTVVKDRLLKANRNYCKQRVPFLNIILHL
jgi:hypothetical protein